MYLQLNDCTLYYEEAGSSIPLLCLPPFPFTHRIWREQHELATHARLLLPDLRGTGQSSVSAIPSTMELLAEDMFALLDHLHIDQVVVMGVSMGVYVAFAMYAAYPRRLSGLVLADSRPQADSLETAERRRQTVDALRIHGVAILRERVNDLFADATHRDHPELVEEMQQQVLQENPEGLAQLTLGMALRPERQSLLAQIRVPTLVVCGEEDHVSPPAVMREMAENIPEARFQLIPGAGHLSPLEQPGPFNEVVSEFLQSVK